MARPLKDGLEYFPLDIDLFDDDKILDLINEYGPLGEVVYLRILCLIYRNGYYYKFQTMDKLAARLIKSIGNKWVRDKQVILQIIPFLAECNLLSSELMQENVLTSVGIQRRYLNVAKRRLKGIQEYSLLREGLNNVPNTQVSDTETGVNATETQDNDANNATKESKEKESKAEERRGNEAAASSDLDDLYKYFQANISPVTMLIRQDLLAWLEKVDIACIRYAIEEAARSGKPSPKYVYAILQRLYDDGMTTGDALAMGRTGKPKAGKMSFEQDHSV